MKRSKSIRLLLLSTASAGALAGCQQSAPISATAVYTNNFYVAGVGYYHAPFCAWYSLPFNHYDPQRQSYFYGGKWGAQPFESIINISSHTVAAAAQAEAARTDIDRGGFGSTYHGHYFVHS